MPKFIIQPHDRLHEMVAHELGYFAAEGLDYEIDTRASAQVSKLIDSTGALTEIRSGAYQSYEQGKGNKGAKSDISCACHWTVNNAAANRLATMYGKAYVVTPGGVMVRGNSAIRLPEELAGTDIAVGYQSGSHYSKIQALEAFLKPDEIKLKYVGRPWQRLDVVMDGDLQAASLWGLTYQVAEQLGLRKVGLPPGISSVSLPLQRADSHKFAAYVPYGRASWKHRLQGTVHGLLQEFVKGGRSRNEFYSRASRLTGFGLAIQLNWPKVSLAPYEQGFAITARGVRLVELLDWEV